MNGYLVQHELQINRQAASAKSLASEILSLASRLEEVSALKGWEGEAADSQRDKLRKLVGSLRETANRYSQLGDSLYYFTASHKTWLEDIVDKVTEALT